MFAVLEFLFRRYVAYLVAGTADARTGDATRNATGSKKMGRRIHGA